MRGQPQAKSEIASKQGRVQRRGLVGGVQSQGAEVETCEQLFLTARAASWIASHLQGRPGADAAEVVRQVRLELTNQRVHSLREFLKDAGLPEAFSGECARLER